MITLMSSSVMEGRIQYQRRHYQNLVRQLVMVLIIAFMVLLLIPMEKCLLRNYQLKK